MDAGEVSSPPRVELVFSVSTRRLSTVGSFMLLNQLAQEHHAIQAQCASMNDNATDCGDANPEPVSGVLLKSAAERGESSANQPAPERHEPKSQAELRAHAMQRFLSSQTDVSEEVLRLYELVCTGFK
jgi:hypothetical protein